MNKATATIESAATPSAFTRIHYYASGENGGAVDLTVNRKDDGNGYRVSWNANKGRGWMKGWKRFEETEESALKFAAEKWPPLVAWLEKLEPEENDGAAEAFSAQVASMRRR